MTITIEGIEYVSASELLEELQISRQTLWRWRQQGQIPLGRLYHSKKLVFTNQEGAAIREFANRLEPTELENANQLKLFRCSGSGENR